MQTRRFSSRYINGDTAAAGGLVLGIVLGSLCLDLSGAAERPAADPQPAARVAGISAAAGSDAISQR